MGKELPFDPNNYEPTDYEGLHDSYLLDLLFQDKLEEYYLDDEEEEITEEDWENKILEDYANWSEEVGNAEENKFIPPDDDFQLLKAVFPSLETDEFETPFSQDEAEGIPYNNYHELFQAAARGELANSNLGEYSLDGALKELETAKEKSIKRLEAIRDEMTAKAMVDFPDEIARKHYQEMRKELADLFLTDEERKKRQQDFERKVDEMARLACKSKEEHHHHHHDEHHEKTLSPEEEFAAKYGKRLSDIESRGSDFKSNPATFIEKTIERKFGQDGISAWRALEEAKVEKAKLSEAEAKAQELEFIEFLKRA